MHPFLATSIGKPVNELFHRLSSFPRQASKSNTRSICSNNIFGKPNHSNNLIPPSSTRMMLAPPLTQNQGTFSKESKLIFIKELDKKGNFQGARVPLLFIIINIRIIKMTNVDKQNWIELGDLQSYSFDGFYNKNQFPICNDLPFELQLNNDPEPFIHPEYMLETRMETNQPNPPQNLIRDEEDYFYFDSENSGTKQREETLNDDEDPQDRKRRKEKEQTTKNKKIKKEKKSNKNQYDKNILGNITTVVIKKMLAPDAEKEIQYYCGQKQVDLSNFRSYFTAIQRTKARLGTTQLSKFYESQDKSEGFKAVFSMFMVRFLREQYLLYVIREGKMQEKQKYLSCATKLMYIPRLRKEEYCIISNLMNKV